MKLRSIEFAETDDVTIASATVTITREEIAYLAKLLGGMNNIQADEVLPEGGVTSHYMYECLVGDIINPYHENGVDELVQTLR